jgi:hypothetical protein
MASRRLEAQQVDERADHLLDRGLWLSADRDGGENLVQTA